MRTAGIIAEYNPFHSGHAYHIRMSKAITGAENVICVMSGDFVQRGEPAIIDKYARTRMALENGADIVIGLPVMYSTASAEFFAFASIFLLEATKTVDCVCFGSEDSDVDRLTHAAIALLNETDSFKNTVRGHLKAGESFAYARGKAANDSALLNKPNNILAVEYIKALKRLESPIEPIAVLREGSSHNNTFIEGSISSAGAVRAAALSGDWSAVYGAMPKSCADTLRASHLSRFDDYSLLLHNALLSGAALDDIAGITEGIENRIAEKAGVHYSISDILAAVKTKRYTMSGLRRAMLSIVLNLTKTELRRYRNCPQYIRILGFRKEKECLLGEIAKKSALPVIVNVKQHNGLRESYPLAFDMLAFDIKAGGLYRAAAGSPQSEYRQKVVIV